MKIPEIMLTVRHTI